MRARRKWLVAAALAFSAVGVFGVARLFGGAMGLPANAGDTLPRVDVSQLAAGHFMLVDSPSRRPEFERYLILRRHDGQLAAFLLYRRDGLTIMPDYQWYRFAYACHAFGPAPSPGAFPADAVIRCYDEEVPEFWRELWRWNLEGHALRPESYIPDMWGWAIAEEAGGFAVLGKPADVRR